LFRPNAQNAVRSCQQQLAGAACHTSRQHPSWRRCWQQRAKQQQQQQQQTAAAQQMQQQQQQQQGLPRMRGACSL
jgi:hypothetical protein